MELLKLGDAAAFKVDVPLPFNVRDESGHLLLAKGRMISATQLPVLLLRGMYVDREEYRAAAAAAARAAQRGGADTTRVHRTVFDQWEQCVGQLDRLLRGIASEADFPARMHAFATQFLKLVDQDPDVAIFVSMQQDPRRMQLYALTHALHTALACRLATQRLEWAPERQATLVKAALTMNVAMLDLQSRLSMQAAPLTDEQRKALEAHPQAGCDMLRAAGVADDGWLQTVRDHHERPGGGGYPRGIDQPHELAAVLRLADVFMAKISPRAARAPLSIQDAAHRMLAESPGSPVAAAMIKGYGVYPPGDFVQLASGETAIVLRGGTTAHTPVVVTLTDRSGVPTVNTVRRDTGQAPFRIVGKARGSHLALPSVERLYAMAR